MEWLDKFVEVYGLKPIALFLIMITMIIICLCIDSDKSLPKGNEDE